MTVPISVVVPFSDNPRYLELLPEAIESIFQQIDLPDEIVLVADGFKRPCAIKGLWTNEHVNLGVVITETYLVVRGGVPNAFNTGVEVARNQLVLMMGCDDLLKPTCVNSCWNTYVKHCKDALYYLDVEYDPGGETQSLPCGHALVTKRFWHWVGGYSINTAQGACDAALCSVLLKHHPELLIRVETDKPEFICRTSLDSYTGRSQIWQGVILETRRILTDTWTPNDD